MSTMMGRGSKMNVLDALDYVLKVLFIVVAILVLGVCIWMTWVDYTHTSCLDVYCKIIGYDGYSYNGAC